MYLDRKTEDTTDLQEFADSRGIIDQRKLFDFLNGVDNQRRTKSVMKSSAQATTSCAPPTDVDMLLKSVGNAWESAKRDNPRLSYLIEIQLLNGLRISEALNIHWSRINALGQIHIRGLKGSKDRIVNTGSSAEFFISCLKNQSSPFAYFSRFYVYREYKKLGLSHQFNGRGVCSVTHLFRHLVVKLQRSSSTDYLTIQQFIGHKSINSTKIYGK